MKAKAPPAPKYVEVADTLEKLIRQGRWRDGRMPSVRGVAKDHCISVVTASRAMQVLRDKGLVKTVHRSGCYRVPPPTTEKWVACLRVTPGPWQAAATSLVRDGFEELSLREQVEVRFDSFALADGLTPAAAGEAVRAAKRDGVRGVFLLPSRVSAESAAADHVFLAACREEGLPVVLLERNLRGLRGPLPADLVGFDDVGAAAACTRHLLDTGRKRVGIVVASPVSTHNDRVAGYLFELSAGLETKRKAERTRAVVIRQPCGLAAKDAYAAVAAEVVREKLDGVVCYSDYTALGLIMELMSRGVRVPHDVGVVGFDNLPIGDSFAIGLTTYGYDATTLAEHALRAIRQRVDRPEDPPVKITVPGELIVRGSTVL